MDKKTVYLVVRKAHSDFQVLGFKFEFEAFVDGDRLDEPQLTGESKAQLIASFVGKYDVVYVNGVRV